MPENLIIIGAATPTIIRVVDDINQAGARQINIVGFLDSAHATLGNDFFGFNILGGFDAIKQHDPKDVVLINTISGSVAARVATTEHFLALGYRFTNIIHPGVNIKYVKIGTGNLIYESALIHPFVQISNHCVISSNSGIAHDSVIGDYCFVGPASYICGKVTIEDRVFIGTGAKVLPRLKIGAGARIAACAMVNKDVAPDQFIVGIPGRAR